MTAGVKEKYDQRIADGLIPDARWGTPEDVGKAVAALLRGDVRYATGSGAARRRRLNHPAALTRVSAEMVWGQTPIFNISHLAVM